MPRRTSKLILIVIGLMVLTNAAFAQATKPGKQPGGVKPKMKTIRLQIDGFQKSKSGAI